MREVGGPAALDMEFEFLQVLPMHDCKHLIGEACNLLNSEWPRSKTARYQSLFMSCEKFPTSLVLVLNDFQVVGHVKLSEITVKGPDIMVESVIISKEHRGKGWGKMLMEDAEEYVRRRGKKMLYLSTRGQEGFYEKLGYEVCKPILYYGVALEPSSDGEIKVNGDLPKNKVPPVNAAAVVNGVTVWNGETVQSGVKNGGNVLNGVKNGHCGAENGESVRNVVGNGEKVQNGVENGPSVQNGVEHGNIVPNCVQNSNSVLNGSDTVKNVVCTCNAPSNGPVENVVSTSNVPSNGPVENVVSRCTSPSNRSVICPMAPPPPPLPTTNVKSRTIFRDIKSSKTYMGKSVRTNSHVNFLRKES